MLLLATANELIPLPVDPSTRLLVGILTALGSMACWVITSLSFTTAGKRFGSTSVNVVRSVLAAIFLFFVVKQLSGSFFPFDLSLEILLLSLSGVLGLAVGDQLIFAAFNRAGPRLTLLVLNLVPVATAFLAWPTLGEPLNPFGWIGILLTISAACTFATQILVIKKRKLTPFTMYTWGSFGLVTGFLMFLIPNVWGFGVAMMFAAGGAALLVPAYTLFATEKQSDAPGAAAGYLSMSHTTGYGVASLLAFTSTLSPVYPIYLCIVFAMLILAITYSVKRKTSADAVEQPQ